MPDCAAPRCDRPIPDVAYVCPGSAVDLAAVLHDAAELWPELETTIAGQARMAEPGPRPRGRTPPQPIRPGLGDPADDQADGMPSGLPVQLYAAEVRDAVRNTVTTWARLIAEERGTILPVGRTPTVLAWLAGQLGWARYQRWAGECWDELGYACSRIAPAVDRPRPRVDAGECLAPTEAGPCRQRLSAAPSAAYVHCPVCRTTQSAVDRREVLLAGARTLRGTAEEVAVWLTILGVWTTSAMVRGLGHRGRVLADAAGRYSVAEVEALRRVALGRVAVAA